MDKQKILTKQLDHYSTIGFDNDLNNLEHDVRKKINSQGNNNIGLTIFMEKLFGMPLSLSGGALASTLIVGILIGTQIQSVNTHSHNHGLDLEVFSPVNSILLSSLLDPKQ